MVDLFFRLFAWTSVLAVGKEEEGKVKGSERNNFGYMSGRNLESSMGVVDTRRAAVSGGREKFGSEGVMEGRNDEGRRGSSRNFRRFGTMKRSAASWGGTDREGRLVMGFGKGRLGRMLGLLGAFAVCRRVFLFLGGTGERRGWWWCMRNSIRGGDGEK